MKTLNQSQTTAQLLINAANELQAKDAEIARLQAALKARSVAPAVAVSVRKTSAHYFTNKAPLILHNLRAGCTMGAIARHIYNEDTTGRFPTQSACYQLLRLWVRANTNF